MIVLSEWALLVSPMLVSRPLSPVYWDASVLALQIHLVSLELSNGFGWQQTKLPQVHLDRVAGTAVEVVRDRAAAIAAGVAAAGAGDVVLVAGKGSEEYQLVAADVLPFSDVAEAQRALGAQE